MIPAHLKDKKTASLFLVVVLMLVLFSLYYVLPFFSRYMREDKDKRADGFEKMDLGPYHEKISELMIIHEQSNPSYWEDWRWEDKMFFANIYKIDHDLKNILLYINNPGEDYFPDKWKLINVRCSRENTVAVGGYNPTVNLIGANFDLFDKAVEGDMLYSYCLDENCLNAGNKCILVKVDFHK